MKAVGSKHVGVGRARTLMESTFPGESEMAVRCREFDWSKTAVGPVETWSHALRTTVSTVLSSRNPMFIFWGPSFVQFYNDAYRPSLGLGDRHLTALGNEGPKFWTDIWHIIGPELEETRNGVPSWHEDALIPIERNGTLENVWWTYGYSPVFDDDGSIGGVLVVCMETTQRHLDEVERASLMASLISEKATLGSIFDLSPSFLAVARGPNHVFERVNAPYITLVGNRPIVGESVEDAFPEIRDQGLIEILDRVRETGKPFIGTQVPLALARGDGGSLETRYVDFVYQRIVDHDGDPVIIAHGMDVTDQVMAADALKRVELQLRDQFAKLPVPTLLWEERAGDFLLVDFNEAAKRTFPVSDEAAAQGIFLSSYPNTAALIELFEKCLKENIVCEYAATLPSPGGTRTYDLTVGPQQPNRLLVHAVDTTRRAELEEQLRQAQKMEAVGQLAGGIAHDFNNILTVIEGHSALLMDALGEDDERYGDAEEINKAGVRAAGLTRQLLAFSNKQILKPGRLGLNDLIHHTAKMLSRLLGENIGMELDLHAAPDEIMGDATQYSQVLMNLALNARDAMKGHGTLKIVTGNVAANPSPLAEMVPPVCGYILVEVSDNGAGMSEEIQKRIFEPFFTTKPEGMGTGLGLATVYSIVVKAGGCVSVESNIGVGSKFSVYLPAASGSAPSAIESRAEANMEGYGETVLLVEDELAVRQVVKRILESHGYMVLAAEDGPSAISLATSYPGRIDLVISDTVMPGMGGAEVVAHLKELRPGLKALFMSGHTDDQLLRSGIRAATVKFIQKPFVARDFTSAVRDALL